MQSHDLNAEFEVRPDLLRFLVRAAKTLSSWTCLIAEQVCTYLLIANKLTEIALGI